MHKASTKIAENQHLVIVGRLGSTHGIYGWLKVNSYTAEKENILKYLPWQLNFKNTWKPVTVRDFKIQGNTILILLEGCNNPETARLFTNVDIAVNRNQLPALKKNEYYWSDLEGLTVVTLDGKMLGTVAYLFETGSNDVLVVKGEKEHLIPYLPKQTIKSISLVDKIIQVNWDPEF